MQNTWVDTLPKLTPVEGLRLGSFSSGLKKNGDLDLVLIEAISGTRCAAVFTKNAFCAAPVVVSRAHLEECNRFPRALIINMDLFLQY